MEVENLKNTRQQRTKVVCFRAFLFKKEYLQKSCYFGSLFILFCEKLFYVVNQVANGCIRHAQNLGFIRPQTLRSSRLEIYSL